MSVFALGLCLFFLLEREFSPRSFLTAHPDLACALSLVAMAGSAFVALPQWLDPRVPLPPTFLFASFALAFFILALARSQPGFFLNSPIALLGRVSFSAYLLHFAVLKIASDQPFLQGYLHIGGWHAILAFATGLACVVLVTLARSCCLHGLVELPMIQIGKAVIRWRRPVVLPGVPRMDVP